jgi:hypothetical protein
MVAAVPAHGNQDLAAAIMAVGPICIEDANEEDMEDEEEAEVVEVKPVVDAGYEKEYF